MQTYYQLVDSNKRKSLLVIAGFILFVFAAVYVMAQAFDFGLSFVGVALIISGIMSFASYYYSDKIILSISGARPATREEFFDYYTVTENLCLATGLPFPKLYVIDDPALNAFATGRDPDHAVVCATTGLINRLDRTELEGVVAHELSHIRNYDIRLMSIVTILIGVIALLSDWFLRMSFFGGGRRSSDKGGQVQAIFMIAGIVLALLSPLIANLIKLAISRRREFLADASAASMTKYPEGLARALEKLAQDRQPLKAANKATAHLYISNPLKNHHDAIGWFAGMFSTHPPIEERINALRS
jgi:heat shock protein HtpX